MCSDYEKSISRGCRRHLRHQQSHRQEWWSVRPGQLLRRSHHRCWRGHLHLPQRCRSQLLGFGELLKTCFPLPFTGRLPQSRRWQRQDYHYWRRLQYKLRVQYTLEQSTDRTGQKPRASRVQRAMAKETTWTNNVPSVDSVLLAWVPCQEPSPVANDPLLIASVVHQKWKGLAIKHFEGKGKGVIATMKFQKNQVVCDYHGEEVSKQEGERRLETLAGEPSYLFFFKGKGGEPLRIDAQKFPCDCHPDKETFGRRMNHSRRRNNVWPRRVSLNCPEGPRECVLFCALRDIAVSEELLWDYCVCRASFRGKGRGLPWLDD
ncbi:N-lysine methyltransferase KMT5A-B-like isoform X1 [Onychostoma macrolepis]|uniref:SET domain-containing protein n=1 Tax=Onychostoma macrolepis TaxID=369639 RepID=A0A7J6CD63_9TELE|nr:N-lysine methyltransferase KMT5A-B-like isoform X1 [Onychostoma macrolepis]KAF4103762.1 hypothetical protein G5714_014749 [Onychostoma macrolepis]